jgi:hypothetical protein
VDSFWTDAMVARLGAACLGARSPWTNVAAAGPDHALGRSLVLAAARPAERRAAFRSAPAPQTAQQATWRLAQQAQPAAPAAELLPTAGIGTGTGTSVATVSVTRKPKNVHKTRINAGGYGAMGPHPEREQLA